MRFLAFFAIAVLSAVPALVGAESLEQDAIALEASGERAENIDALPGSFRLAAAPELRLGLAVGVAVGYGYTEDVLQLDDKHHRAGGSVAATFRPTRWLAAGVRLDGRYDRHRGSMIEADDGWVGSGRINVLATHQISSVLGIGGQIVGWVPGGFAGTSVDVKAIATAALGPASVTANAGFRLDRSAESVDDADLLSPSDRLALGVSDSNAVLLGLGGEADAGPVTVLAEATWDILVGGDAPALVESPLRVGAGVRFPVSKQHAVAAMLEGSLGRAPFIASMQPLVPVEPLLGFSIILSHRPAGTSSSLTTRYEVDPITTNTGGDGSDGDGGDGKTIDPRAKIAGLGGTVVDDSGNPVPGAVVRIAGREIITSDSGNFVAEQLEPGSISLQISAEGYGDATETVKIAKDEVRQIRVILKRLELGLLRGVVRGYDGSPVVAEIKVMPGDLSTTSKADGTFSIRLPAGKYTATASADGFRAGRSTATITIPGPTVIVNIELQKTK